MTKRVAWFTGEPSVKDCFTPHKVYEVVREEDTNFSVINDKGVKNYCLKKGCARICHKDWVFADVVEEENVVESVEDAAQPITTKQPKWSEWIKNTTGKCPEGLKRKQKIKLKWSDGDKFVIGNPHDAAWYFSQGYNPVDITHYKVKLDTQPKLKEKKEWTKNTGVCPVDGRITVMMKFSDGTVDRTQAQEYSWDFGQSRKIIKWRLVD
jgi:hypothetical protein